MSTGVHPKTSGASLGGSLGLVIVAVLESIRGVHIVPELAAAIPSFLATLGAFLSPGNVQGTNPPQAPDGGPEEPLQAAPAVYSEGMSSPQTTGAE